MKKKIFHIIPTLSSGGAERQLVDVVCNTSNEKFTHTVCVLDKADFFGEAIRQSGHEVIDLNLSGKHPWLSAVKKILPIIRRQKPAVIHSWLFDANIISRLLKLSGQKIPLITSLQNVDYESETIESGNLPPKKIEVLRLIDKFSAKLTDPYFVACSKAVADSYIKKLGIKESRMSVIYNSVDPKTLACEPDEPDKIRRSLEIKKDDFVYINIGRLDPQKGQIYLLKAFQIVLAKVPKAHLLIIGVGNADFESSLKQAAKSMNIEHRVHFLGRRKDIGACLEASEVFVFPSLFEGFGIVLAEAMSKGLASIASRLAVLQEVVDHKVSGLLVTPKSETELAEAMIQIFNEPELRRQLGQKARQKAEDQFFSQVLMPKWEKIYADISADS